MLGCDKCLSRIVHIFRAVSFQWHHNERDGLWSHRRLDCLLQHLFGRRSKKPLKLRIPQQTMDQIT